MKIRVKMIKLKIRKAKPKDAKEISKIRKNTFKNIILKNNPIDNIKFFNRQNTEKKILEKIKKRDMFCLIKDNQIIGAIDLEKNKIGGFFIHHKHIRKGNGTILLRFIEDYARKKKIKKVRLYSTKYGYPFYLKHKYKLIKKRFWNINGRRVINYEMEKRL
jgi:N-acetylglutamate synthase-like GNAT family acetyltransferase